jgi:prevent-host-death family protein
MVVSYGSAEFKAHCLRILDEVAESGQSVLLTKRGRPVARLVPVVASAPLPVFGLLKGSVQWTDNLYSTGEPWNAGS